MSWLLVAVAHAAEVVTRDDGRPIAAITRTAESRACEVLQPIGGGPRWLEGDWVTLSEDRGTLVLCRYQEVVRVDWRVDPTREDREAVARALGGGDPPSRRVEAKSGSTLVQFYFAGQAGSWEAAPSGVQYDGAVLLESHMAPANGELLAGTLSASILGARQGGFGGHAELMMGVGSWVNRRVEPSLVAGVRLEGQYGLLPFAAQLPVEARLVLDPHRFVRLDLHGRGAFSLSHDPMRRGLPDQDWGYGLDLWFGSRTSGARPNVVLGADVREVMGTQRVGVHVGLGAADP